MLPEIPAEELAACLDRTAARLLKRCAVRRPPVDALRMAAALGIEIAFDAGQAIRARYVELRAARGGNPRPAILLRPEPRSERRQWAVAHELGEREAAVVFQRLAIDPRAAPPTAREWVANQLANRILLPTRWLAAAGAACGWDLLALKERFSTASHELIARRMLEFEPPVVVTIFDHGKLSFRQGNRGGRLALTPLERTCWRSSHLNGVIDARADAGYTVRCWPVHEPEWKRELLRLDVLDEPEMWCIGEPAMCEECG
ncbi:MAG TPA: ImmA/IrrE family metallo-endopeptidase [Pirellulales bacterium]|nr:ImmA/IrrE family metallo-endopeptidase [Pirellulales bacterium]